MKDYKLSEIANICRTTPCSECPFESPLGGCIWNTAQLPSTWHNIETEEEKTKGE